MKSLEEMVRLNKEQAQFYDGVEAGKIQSDCGYAGNKQANIITRTWAALRARQYEAVRLAGVEARVKGLHMKWVHQLQGGRFLEIGCHAGSPMTMELAEVAGTYLGVELSALAVENLNAKFREKGMDSKAKAMVGDVLVMEDPQGFDLVYAHGVLHHFENPKVIFEKIRSLLRPGGLLLFVDPCAVNPVYRALRALFRPFQSDAAWEWPFTQTTVSSMDANFTPVEGFGWGRLSLPLSPCAGLPLVGALVKPVYLKCVANEMQRPWDNGVWGNSMVAGVAKRR